MNKLKLYRTLIFVCIFLTGTTGLVFQVIWQKYLSYLVGSESRSISLVVAIFLFGLASGYFFWGKLTEKNLSRRKLLKIYGCIEFAIAIYAFLFAYSYQFLEHLAYSTPDNIFVDMLVCMLALFFPTFLMGATVPVLTAVIPEETQEINYCHAYVYGLNTLGAFSGVFLGAFLLIPNLGLSSSLFIAGSINLVIAFIFIGNRLEGQVDKREEVPHIPNCFGNVTIYVFVFITGAISISFEVLFIRLLNLTIGPGRQVFPIVVGLFVLGLAVGALTLYRGIIKVSGLLRTLAWITFYMVILYLSVPYWPYWVHHIRVSITSLPSNYYVFIFFVTLFLTLISFPLLIPLGRLLPIGYFLIRKSRKNYGKICGRLYFFSALGTMAGSIFLGHLFLHFLEIDHIFKINIIIFGLLCCFMIVREKRWGLSGIVAVITITVFFIPQLNRDSHYVGLYRKKTLEPYSFSGFFEIPKADKTVEFFEDGPNTTVTVLKSPEDQKVEDKSLVVNGKSDGNTSGDSSTVISLATLPYFLAGKDTDLSAAVIGLGTGITSGILASAEDVESVTTLEISPSVIKTVSLFDQFTNDLSENPKSRLIETDAFKFFAKVDHRFDIIVSEPSNLWVAGVENLYTPEFYQLVEDSLHREGVFMQWLHIYAITKESLFLVLENLTAVFPELRLFRISNGDVGILAAKSRFNVSHQEKRFQERAIQNFYERLGVENLDQVYLQEIYTTEAIKLISESAEGSGHNLNTPRLAHLAGKAFFLDEGVNITKLIDLSMRRWAIGSDRRRRAMARLAAHDYKFHHTYINKFHYDQWNQIKTNYDVFKDKDNGYSLYQQVMKYRTLRLQGLISADIEFLESTAIKMMPSTASIEKLSWLIIQELTEERYGDRAVSILDDFIARGLIRSEKKTKLLGIITANIDKLNRFLSEYSG